MSHTPGPISFHFEEEIDLGPLPCPPLDTIPCVLLTKARYDALMEQRADLLTACKRARNFLYNLPAQDAFFLSLSPQLREFYKEAAEGLQSAINKAKGEE